MSTDNTLALAKALEGFLEGRKHDTASVAPNSQPAHGPYIGGTGYGPFSEPGVDPLVPSALPQPRTFTDVIALERSDVDNEVVQILTGQLAAEGTNPDNYGGTPMTPGDLKTCSQVYQYGQIFLGTKGVSVPHVGMRYNRADEPKRLLNSAPDNDPLVPQMLRTGNLNTSSRTSVELFKLYTQVRRSLTKTLVTGSTANTGASAEDGFINEVNGLDQWVKTGRIDAGSKQECPAADSYVVNWNAEIGATNVDNQDIVELLLQVFFGQNDVADQLGLNVQWAWVMPSRLFRILTQSWACAYPTTFCDSTNGRFSLDEQRRFRDELALNQVLEFQGRRIPVLFSDGIPVADNGTTLQSDMYLLPIAVNGSTELRLQYFPMDNASLAEWNGMANTTGRVVSNDGLYMFAKRSTGFVDEIMLASQMRLMMRHPFLAARVDDVTFTYANAQYRDPYPGTTKYVDGGVTYYAGEYS